jgi:hypothetical protein
MTLFRTIKFIQPLVVSLFLLSSCSAANKELVSLEVQNTTSREITKIVVFSEMAERGVRLYYIVPTGRKSWYPFDIRLKGALSVKIWWNAKEMADCSIPITKQDEDTIKSHKYLIVVVREKDVQLLTGDDPDKAATLKAAQLIFSIDDGSHHDEN